MDFLQKKIGPLIKKVVRSAESIPYISTTDVKIGQGVTFGRNVRFNSKKIRIGDYGIFEDNIRVDSEEFHIGDFAHIYSDCFFPGPGSLSIGHNFWIGKGAIVDAMGGAKIGNNVGIGGQSQLWTHIEFGDTLAGCRFDSNRELLIEDDVWFVGHCLVSPIKAHSRSLAMLGSVVVKDMAANHCYAGTPAIDITDKVGPQFKEISPDRMAMDLGHRIDSFKKGNPQFKYAKIGISTISSDILDGKGYDLVFNVADRTYTKRGSELEHLIIRYLLQKAKFLPVVS